MTIRDLYIQGAISALKGLMKPMYHGVQSERRRCDLETAQELLLPTIKPSLAAAAECSADREGHVSRI